MVSELKVTIKDEDKKLDKKFLVYEIYTIDDSDPVIKRCIEETLKGFDGNPDNVIVNIKLEMQ